MMQISETNQLHMFDIDEKKVTIQTPEWKKLFRTVLNGAAKGWIGVKGKNQAITWDPVDSEPFWQGKAAMMVDYSNTLSRMPSPNFAWDIVSVPVNPATPGESASVYPNDLFAINASSRQVDAAWKLIEFITGENFAKIAGRSGTNGGLLMRTEYNTRQNRQLHMDSIYQMKPTDRMLQPTSSPMYQMGDEAFKKVLEKCLRRSRALKTCCRSWSRTFSSCWNRTIRSASRRAGSSGSCNPRQA